MIIKNFIRIALFVAFMLPHTGFAQRMGIAAVVNEDIITYSDVEGRVQLGMRASNIKDTPETRRKLEMQALDSLIEEQLRLQEAKRLNIEVTPQNVESAIDNIAAQNKVEPAKFRDVLSRGYAALPSLKRQIEAQLAWTQVVRMRLRPQVNVTEADIDIFINDLNQHEGKNEYNIAEIVLSVNSPSEDNDKKALADDLIKQIKNGASFPGIARQFSQGKEARNGGVIGWVLEGVTDPKIDNVIKTMTPGAISNPIKTDMGYHIVLLRDKRTVNTTAANIEKVNLKQILLPLGQNPDETEMTNTQAQAMVLKNETTNCEAMDQLLSQQNNPLSKDLGMVPENQMPPVIQNAIDDLPEGSLSAPIRVTEGFLMVMACGRETSSTSEQLRDQIANKIGAERLERLQQRYVRDLRATAYIDIKN